MFHRHRWEIESQHFSPSPGTYRDIQGVTDELLMKMLHGFTTTVMRCSHENCRERKTQTDPGDVRSTREEVRQ